MRENLYPMDPARVKMMQILFSALREETRQAREKWNPLPTEDAYFKALENRIGHLEDMFEALMKELTAQ